MRSYENILIFDPTIEEDAVEKELKEIENTIKQTSGEVLSIDKWGKKKLAYPIKKKDTGYYVLLNLKLEHKTLGDIELGYKLNQNILRYSIIRKEEDAGV